MKIDKLVQKVVIRNHLKSVFPPTIHAQKKKGFGLDLSQIDEIDNSREYLLDRDSIFNEYVSRDKIESNYDKLDSYQKFTLIVFKKWINGYLNNGFFNA